MTENIKEMGFLAANLAADYADGKYADGIDLDFRFTCRSCDRWDGKPSTVVQRLETIIFANPNGFATLFNQYFKERIEEIADELERDLSWCEKHGGEAAITDARALANAARRAVKNFRPMSVEDIVTVILLQLREWAYYWQEEWA